VKLFFLLAAFTLPLHSANAGVCDSLARAFVKLEAIEAQVGNVRKNISALLFKPEELKKFDSQFFDFERDRIAALSMRHPLLASDLDWVDPPRPDVPAYDETPPSPGKPLGPSIDVTSFQFETKLAYLEVAIQNASGGTRSLQEALDTLPPYRTNRLIQSVNRLFSENPITETALQYQIGDLYVDLLKWHYPHILEGIGTEQVEQTLKSTLEARLVSRSVEKTLRDAGLIKENPSVFKAYFESFLKGQGFEYFLNAQINGAMIKGALNSNLVPYWVVPPRVRFNRWIEIPEELLLEAENRGLLPAWTDSIQPYLIDRYGTLTRTDLIYTRLQKFWSGATYYAFMGWLAFTLTWTVPSEVKIKSRQIGVQHQFESPHALPSSQEKAVLNDAEKKARWNEWLRSHPNEARSPDSLEYRLMHRMIFGQ
jgi:hypothetical protein